MGGEDAVRLTFLSVRHILSSQSSTLGGCSGRKTKSAPVLHRTHRTGGVRVSQSQRCEPNDCTHETPARRASHPQCRPITSTTNAREWDEAVDEIESTDSQIRWSAVRPPTVKSVIAMSLLGDGIADGNLESVSRPTRSEWDRRADVLDGSDDSDNVEVGVVGRLVLRDLAWEGRGWG